MCLGAISRHSIGSKRFNATVALVPWYRKAESSERSTQEVSWCRLHVYTTHYSFLIHQFSGLVAFIISLNTKDRNLDTVHSVSKSEAKSRHFVVCKIQNVARLHQKFPHILNTTPNSTIHIIAKGSASASGRLLGSLKAWAYHVCHAYHDVCSQPTKALFKKRKQYCGRWTTLYWLLFFCQTPE